jgi:hypothetical protein
MSRNTRHPRHRPFLGRNPLIAATAASLPQEEALNNHIAEEKETLSGIISKMLTQVEVRTYRSCQYSQGYKCKCLDGPLQRAPAKARRR